MAQVARGGCWLGRIPIEQRDAAAVVVRLPVPDLLVLSVEPKAFPAVS